MHTPYEATASSIGRRICAVCLLAMLSACAHQPAPPAPAAVPVRETRVNYKAVPDKHLKHYTLAASQTAISPDPQPDNPAPSYPADLVARNLPPVTVTALLIVNAKGQVTEARIASQASGSALIRRFDEAVRSATMTWRFAPMRIANWVEDASGDMVRTGTVAKPFSQAYQFRFEVHDGKPQVSSGTGGQR